MTSGLGTGKPPTIFYSVLFIYSVRLPGVSIPGISTDAATAAVLIVLDSVPATVHLVVVVILQIEKKIN